MTAAAASAARGMPRRLALPRGPSSSAPLPPFHGPDPGFRSIAIYVTGGARILLQSAGGFNRRSRESVGRSDTLDTSSKRLLESYEVQLGRFVLSKVCRRDPNSNFARASHVPSSASSDDVKLKGLDSRPNAC